MELKSLIVLGAALVVASGARASFVQCEDRSLCPDGATCCKIDDRTWGCCPYEFGQCCKDGLHCCPSGYSCDGANSSCTHKVTQQGLFGTVLERVSPLARAQRDEVSRGSLAGNVRCPDGNYCLDGQTCCLLTSGHYGCCPYAHAQCCSDHTSCCPEGYQCKVSTHQCVHATSNHTVAMAKKVDPTLLSVASPRNGPLVNKVRCPDGNYCPDGQTCCLLTTGHYGCCPFRHAQCCSDHKSCCPEGYQCKVSTHQCVHATSNHTVAMAAKVGVVTGAPRQVEVDVSELSVQNVRCPDGNYCRDGQTCCLLTTGHYGCCPFRHAQCCSDHKSCCPEGYQCKVSTHQCVHATSNHTVAMVAKVGVVTGAPRQVEVDANELSVQNARCPDGSYCRDDQTCCLLTTGHYGCCPFRNAQCCSDHTSCCPEGYQCQVSMHKCVLATSNHTVAMAKKVDPIDPTLLSVAIPRNGPLVNEIPCPDGNYCPDGQTCCALSSGHYGCCPYPDAVCCSDHTSCCPEGYHCKVETHECLFKTSNHTVAMVAKVGVVKGAPRQVEVDVSELSVQNVPCPDGNFCLDGQTCCLLTTGQYGCCPYAHAQCCSDHASCCPEGYICKVSTRQCLHSSSNHTVPMGQKVRPLVLSATKSASSEVTVRDNHRAGERIKCPDGAYCQDTQTCCLLTSGRYGCCPYVHAECCSDHSSCCPEGYHCKVSTKQCIHATSNHTFAAAQKVDSIVPQLGALSPPVSDGITCPDGHKCLSGQTCCQVKSGKYGCCPLPEAVCCSDHRTCCPKGYQCRVATQMCQLADHWVPAVLKLPSFTFAALIEAAALNQVCPDGNECDDEQTCCQLQSGSYGCCPYNQAVCCDDRAHCCPAGYTCDTEGGRCLKGSLSSPMRPIVPKRRSRPMNRILVNEVKTTCPDQSICPDKMTCCQSNRTYVCCPFDKATCCADGEHCCPEGYQCDEARRMCTRKLRPVEVPALEEFSSNTNP
ncbi:LOW QUALITY PROTEIN: progranulin-like [Dermacentor silvarum]|uniref:LOW QUALITY PROTEIN: progranulin-like n=1 Tax=Dermacentor silvarum TaxID=543639 RepID=UPI0021009413|nr:LOW QUALITY PROTEIN: progranulin-like [Dermacentor silvarum]